MKGAREYVSCHTVPPEAPPEAPPGAADLGGAPAGGGMYWPL